MVHSQEKDITFLQITLMVRCGCWWVGTSMPCDELASFPGWPSPAPCDPRDYWTSVIQRNRDKYFGNVCVCTSLLSTKQAWQKLHFTLFYGVLKNSKNWKRTTVNSTQTWTGKTTLHTGKLVNWITIAIFKEWHSLSLSYQESVNLTF